jgi:cbb3-type cytochrome c oxidase subunit III
MKLSVLVCLAGIGVTAAMGAAAAGTAKTKPKAMAPHASAQLVAQGKDVFAENCIACHQEGAVGLPGTAPSLVNKDLLSIASDRFLSQTIHDGRPDTPMPSFADVLNPDQIKAVIAYLRSFAKEPYRGDSIDAEAPAHGDVLLGQERFQEICSACHGPKGEGYEAGGSGTAIAKIGFLSKASDGFIRATIREGRSGTPMHGFTSASGLANLSYQEIDGIIAYLRSVQGR